MAPRVLSNMRKRERERGGHNKCINLSVFQSPHQAKITSGTKIIPSVHVKQRKEKRSVIKSERVWRTRNSLTRDSAHKPLRRFHVLEDSWKYSCSSALLVWGIFGQITLVKNQERPPPFPPRTDRSRAKIQNASRAGPWLHYWRSRITRGMVKLVAHWKIHK